ncbi:hypothetical protein Q1695_011941 [Nippostrongylus brasiliensis]|nr:hypothetical protein Q1695_011941 [Nippostrongylus brasiliensis]
MNPSLLAALFCSLILITWASPDPSDIYDGYDRLQRAKRFFPMGMGGMGGMGGYGSGFQMSRSMSMGGYNNGFGGMGGGMFGRR